MTDPMSLCATITLGDRRSSLEAIRDVLASKLPAARGASAALIAKNLVEIIRELDSLPTEGEVSPVDQLARARAARLADPTGGQLPPVRQISG